MKEVKEGVNPNKTHELKTWVQYFKDIVYGGKNFELRKNDRGFMVGDTLLLKEWDNVNTKYTNNVISVRVTYILHGGVFGIPDDMCIMSFEVI